MRRRGWPARRALLAAAVALATSCLDFGALEEGFCDSGTSVACAEPICAAPCDSPPGPCFGPSTGCDPVLGCQYPVLVGTGCDDGDACTFDDRCNAGGRCVGTAYGCPGTECASSSCLGDGGCAAPVPRTGQPCDAGVCRADGVCSTFSYSPSNFDPAAVAARGIAPSISIDCDNAWFNSTDGGQFWCPGQPAPVQTVVSEAGGPEVVVLATSGLSMSGSGLLTLVGSRPVILAVWGDAVIGGTVSTGSNTSTGAGAGQDPPGICDAQGGLVSGLFGGGGGGGSYGSRGADGGNADAVARGGRSGSLSGSAALVPLRGGCPGGSGGRSVDPSASRGHGGAGGGAVQISAAGALTVSGAVTASAAAGQGGLGVLSGGNGGGGGGSGGAVLLEGWDVSIPSSGKLTANGGGGGGGGGVANGSTGTDGSPTGEVPAPGGAGGIACAGGGGQGASTQASAQAGGNAASLCSGGGGGGGVGRIRVNGHGTCNAGAGVQSPVPTYGGTCP